MKKDTEKKIEKRIVVVEDNDYIRKVLVDFLSENLPFADVEEAGDGKAAKKKIGEKPPDLIIMDLGLPDISGLELTRTAKSIHPETGIIVHTNYDLPLFRKFAGEWGADLFLSKEKTSLYELLEVVNSFIGERQGHNP